MATKTQHTPGPWVARDRGGMKGRVITAGGTYLIVAEVKTTQNSEENREANARLIAAAPEMLALLRSLVNDAVLPARWTGPDEDGMEVIYYPDEAARALLARIEGV